MIVSGLLSKTKPLSVKYGFEDGENIETHNSEGRLITAEFASYYLVTTYVPNAGRGLVTLDKRMEWDPLFRNHVETLDKKKPVMCVHEADKAKGGGPLEEIKAELDDVQLKEAVFAEERRIIGHWRPYSE